MAKPKITAEIANRLATQHGYLYGLQKALDEYEVSDEQAIKMRAMLYKHLLVKVREAKRETARLAAALNRLEAVCTLGSVPLPQGSSRERLIAPGDLFGAMQAVDGWVISLLESSISLLWTIHNPETAGIRIGTLKEKFANLTYRRFSPDDKGNRYRPFDGYAGIFDTTYYRTAGDKPLPGTQ